MRSGRSETAASLQFDSVHGTWRGHSAVSTSDDAFEVDGKRVAFSEHKDFKASTGRASASSW